MPPPSVELDLEVVGGLSAATRGLLTNTGQRFPAKLPRRFRRDRLPQRLKLVDLPVSVQLVPSDGSQVSWPATHM